MTEPFLYCSECPRIKITTAPGQEHRGYLVDEGVKVTRDNPIPMIDDSNSTNYPVMAERL